MKKTPGSVLHAKVPAIIAAALCGILPPRKGADELKVPRAPCFADENVHLAISWTGDQLNSCEEFGPKVVEGFISVTPIDKWGDACPPHRAIGAAIAYKVNGENCTRIIAWDDEVSSAKNRAGMFFLKRGHAVASRYPLVEDRFVVWPDCRQQYPVNVTPGRYGFQVPPADHFTVAESKASDQVREEQGFTPRTEPPEVRPANFDAKGNGEILHVKTSLVRMAIAIGLVPGQQRSAAIKLPSHIKNGDEVRASVGWNTGGGCNPYNQICYEASSLVFGFKSCEPIGGQQRGRRLVDIRGARISWAKQGDAKLYSFDLTWYGPRNTTGSVPRGWVLAKRVDGDWQPLAPQDRYRADPKLRVAHSRHCASEPESVHSPLRGPDLREPKQIAAIERVAPFEPTPLQRRKIASLLLANRATSDSDFMAPGWRDAQLDFLAPDVVDATRTIRESLGLELMPEINAANEEIAKLLTEAADLRATAEAAIATIGSIHDRIDEISRWLANPVGDYPARPIAFAG